MIPRLPSLFLVVNRTYYQYLFFAFSDIRKINGKYGESVAKYFEFNRWLTLESLFISIISFLFAILHFVDMYQNDHSLKFFSKAVGILPTFMAYSSFSETEGLPYTAVVALGMLFTTLNVFWKLVYEDEVNKHIVAVEGENHTYCLLTA